MPLANAYKNLNVREISSQIKTSPNCGVSTMKPPKSWMRAAYGADLTFVNNMAGLVRRWAANRSDWRRCTDAVTGIE